MQHNKTLKMYNIDLLPRFHVPFWLSHILIFFSVLVSVPVGTKYNK